MNAATRFIAYWDAFGKIEAQASQSIWGIVLASFLVLTTALVLIYVKDLNRHLYSELESLQQNQEDLKIQRDQLLLEQNTWAAQARVREIAQARNMVSPEPSTIFIVKSH